MKQSAGPPGLSAPDTRSPETWVVQKRCLFLFSLTVIVAGVVVLLAGLRHRTRTLELLHQERLAMIEQGLAPPGPSAAVCDAAPGTGHVGRRSRSFSMGIMVLGFGLALMLLISVAGESPTTGIGVGGATAILGAAFVARALLTASPSRAPASPEAARPPAPEQP